jgi:hypothetical protein
MYYNTTGTQNIAIGAYTYSGTTGNYNTVVGQGAMSAGTCTGSNHCAFGFNANSNATSASNNTAIGSYALYTMATGGGCTVVGSGAGQNINNANGQLTAVGLNAASNLTTGGFGTYVGYGVQASSVSVNSEYVFGNSITGKGAGTFYVSGIPYNSNNQSAWSTTSDRRLKKNIVDNNSGLDKITAIQVRNFEYRTEEEVTELPAHSVINKQGIQLGVIAQELQQVLPECVKTESTGVMTVDSDNITWYMINAIKELKAEFDEYKRTHP